MDIEELKEGDVIVLFNHVENRKRVVFCERLDCLALQNSQQDGDKVFKDEFDENVKGNKNLSTFRMLKSYNGNIKVVDFQPIGMTPPYILTYANGKNIKIFYIWEKTLKEAKRIANAYMETYPKLKSEWILAKSITYIQS